MKLLITATLSVAFVSVLSGTGLTQTPVKEVKHNEVSASLPNCYIKTSDNRVVDLSSMCKLPDESSAVNDEDNSTDEGSEYRYQKQSMYKSKTSRVCNRYVDDAGEKVCEQWEASSLPGVPY